jgi:hypothetical protein
MRAIGQPFGRLDHGLILNTGMNATLAMTNDDATTENQRQSERRALAVAGRIVWKDARGTTRFNSVLIRDISETGAYVESLSGTPIPLYRLVSLQAERSQAAEPMLPAVLRQGRVLSAVYRVGPSRPATGAPEGYGLRLLVEPRRRATGTVAHRLAQLVVAQASA